MTVWGSGSSGTPEHQLQIQVQLDLQLHHRQVTSSCSEVTAGRIPFNLQTQKFNSKFIVWLIFWLIFCLFLWLTPCPQSIFCFTSSAINLQLMNATARTTHINGCCRTRAWTLWLRTEEQTSHRDWPTITQQSWLLCSAVSTHNHVIFNLNKRVLKKRKQNNNN